MDFQKLLPGTINLPGVFATILGTFWCEGPRVWGEGLVLDTLLGNYNKPRLWAGCMDCKADFCDDQCIIRALKVTILMV